MNNRPPPSKNGGDLAAEHQSDVEALIKKYKQKQAQSAKLATQMAKNDIFNDAFLTLNHTPFTADEREAIDTLLDTIELGKIDGVRRLK